MSRSSATSSLRTIRIFALLLLLVWTLFRFGDVSLQETRQVSDCENVRVARVVDGDTLLLSDQRRVRLLGVDTPETKHPTLPVQPFGVEAFEYSRQHLEGKTVRLCYDKERFDDYQRTLAFVFVGDELFNETLVRQGFASAETRFPFRSDYKKQLLAAEAIAKEEKLGIWSSPPATANEELKPH